MQRKHYREHEHTANRLSLVECFRTKDVPAVMEWRERVRNVVNAEYNEELDDRIEEKYLTEDTCWNAREWVHGCREGRFNEEHKEVAHDLLAEAGLEVQEADQSIYDEDESDIEWASLVGMVSLMVEYLQESRCAYMMYIQRKVTLLENPATIITDFKHDKLVLGYVYAMWTSIVSGTNTPVQEMMPDAAFVKYLPSWMNNEQKAIHVPKRAYKMHRDGICESECKYTWAHGASCILFPRETVRRFVDWAIIGGRCKYRADDQNLNTFLWEQSGKVLVALPRKIGSWCLPGSRTVHKTKYARYDHARSQSHCVVSRQHRRT